MGEARVRQDDIDAANIRRQMAQQEQQVAMLFQQKEAPFVTGFSIGDAGGCVRLGFAEQSSPTSPPFVRCAVVMPLLAAKQLQGALVKLIAHFEQQDKLNAEASEAQPTANAVVDLDSEGKHIFNKEANSLVG